MILLICNNKKEEYKNMKKMNKKGFTLIELLAVIVILVIIMVIAVPQILEVINSSRKSAWTDNIRLIEKAIELNDSTVNVDPTAGTKVATSGGCTYANITSAAKIDASATSMQLVMLLQQFNVQQLDVHINN